ncbi:hypothetical protein Bhyg_16601, partial [Pseudolycoriella hygida]
ILDSPFALNIGLSSWDFTLPSIFCYSHLNTSAQEEITRSINKFYFGNESTPTNQMDKKSLINMASDRFIVFTETIQKRLEQINHGSTY